MLDVQTLRKAAKVKTIQMVNALITGLNVSGVFWNPLTTKHALYFPNDPSALNLV